MLIVKGFRVSFVLQNGKTVRPPASYALLHDEDGEDWPYCSGLVVPMASSTREPLSNRKAEAYFGYTPYRGSALIPSGKERSLVAWTAVGEVKEVLYTRRRIGGAPATHKGDYYHPIRQRGRGLLGLLVSVVLPSGAKLYKQGRLYRLELARGCVWNWRGIVSP